MVSVALVIFGMASIQGCTAGKDDSSQAPSTGTTDKSETLMKKMNTKCGDASCI